MAVGRLDIDERQYLFSDEKITGVGMDPEHFAARGFSHDKVVCRPQDREGLAPEHREQNVQLWIGGDGQGVLTLDRQKVIRQLVGGFVLEHPGNHGYRTVKVLRGIQHPLATLAHLRQRGLLTLIGHQPLIKVLIGPT
jgi:hypothetical protein